LSAELEKDEEVEGLEDVLAMRVSLQIAGSQTATCVPSPAVLVA
jgi:hypothetical protein